MYSAARKYPPLTLRFRLMLWNAGAVLLTAIVTLVGLREGVYYTLQYEMDQVLIEDLREVTIAIDELGVDNPDLLYEELDRKARGHSHYQWFVRLFDREGRQVWSSINAPPTPLHQPTRGAFAPTTIAGYRLYQHVYGPAGRPQVVIRVGTSLDYMERDIARIDRLVAIAASMVLVIAPLGGYFLAGRTTRILSNIIRTTARARPRKLGERLPVRGTGDELDQLARTINGLLDRIGIYLAQKRDFLANAAHELRTPLAAIRSSVEVALGANRTEEEYHELLGDLIEQCASLEVLVNQLLLLAETDAERMQIQADPVPLHEIVDKSVDMFRGVAESQQVRLVRGELPQVWVAGNAPYLRQVLNNLLDNALKFTPAGGQVTVELERFSSRQQVVLRVRDTGQGIAAEDTPRVFERFFRGDRSRSRDGQTRGTGLGLSICQAVVAAHGGRISVVSQLGQGAAFTVVLPLASIHAGGEQPLATVSVVLGDE